MSAVLPAGVRAFLEEPHHAVMATINASGTPQLTVMWYALHPTEDVVLLNSSRGLLNSPEQVEATLAAVRALA